MLQKNCKHLLLALFLTAQIYAYGQAKVPQNPNDHHDFCSRVSQTKDHNGVAEPRSLHTSSHTVAKSSARATGNCPAGASGWASLSPQALVSELKQNTDSECFSSFFTIESSYAPYIFSNVNIEAVASELYNLSASYDGTKSSGVYGLMYYLHAAIYQDFNNSGVNMNAASTSRYIEACEALTGNQNLFLLTDDALSILDEYLILLDFDGLRHKSSVLTVVKRVLRDLAINKTWKQLATNQVRAYSSAYNRIFFLMFRGINDSNYVNAINGDYLFFELIYAVAHEAELKANNELAFITVNATGELARMMEAAALVDDAESHLAELAQNSPRLSPPWLKAIEAINKYGNCAAYNLCEDMEQVKEELNQTLFPNSYSFDDGKMVVKTPLNEEKVQGLYHAAKQVQNQFYRMIQTDQPVAGDTNDTLTMVVFGSKQEYIDYVTYLFGIGSDNGGMYIESRATFYTWDRTVGVESSLSLEALFRHEYVHYLQGRYLIQGDWGDGEIYNNSRLVWYEEGMAEFFAGSTETEGIKLLASNAQNAQNNTNNWPTLNTVFNSSYTSGNFYHYHYGNMVWYHWYLNDFGKLKTFFEFTRNNDVAGFDNLVNSLRYNGQEDYTNFLTQVANGIVEGWEPETHWISDDQLAIGAVSDVKTEFSDITGITATSATIDATTLNRRFRVTGTLTGQSSTNNTDAAKEAATVLDDILTQLRDNPLLNNFTYSIGYFKNLNYGSGTTTADFIITGPLRDADIPDTSNPDFGADRTVTMTGGSIGFTNESSGYIRSLQWSFPGGSPSEVYDDISPEITYPTAGTYDVTLTTTGNDGVLQSKAKQAFIKVYEKSNLAYCAAAGNREDNYVNQLTFGAIDNASGHQPYSDFTTTVTELTAGTTEVLTIGTKNSHWDDNGVGAWIDWNADGDFDDAGEQVFSQTGAGPYTTTVNVPDYASPGVTRMRIRVTYGAPEKITACGTDSFIGEVEDYSLVISGGEPVAYCSSAASRSTYEHIAKVQMGSFSNPSGASNYSDFTHLNINANKGPNNITLTPGFSGNTYKEYFRVWIDYNQDGDFDDSGELAYDAGTTTTTAVSGVINIPASALSGTTRMRVSMKYQSAPEPCGTIGDGEVEDYTINIGNDETVNAPGSLSATAHSSNSVILNWTDQADNEDGFEIERSHNGGDFSLIASLGANSTTYTDNGLLPGSAYTYRVRAKSGMVYSAYSASSTASTPALSYCAADNNGNPSGQYIKNVKIGSIDNSSTYATGGYSDYSNQSSAVASSATLTVTPHNTWAGTQAKAWIDWNRDGDFDDSGEEVLSASGTTGSYASTVYVPSGTVSGPVRLRIRVAYGEIPTPCGSLYFSEVEDYTLDINNTTSMAGAGPSAQNSSAAVTVYPNPAKGGQFQLICPDCEGDMEISVYNLQGVQVYQQVITTEEGTFGPVEVKLDQKINGTYLVRVKDKTTTTVVRKIIFE